MAKANAPSTVNPLGLAFLGPTVMAIGTDEQKRDIIKPLLHCETIWCQGFSEPGAGSDAAEVGAPDEVVPAQAATVSARTRPRPARVTSRQRGSLGRSASELKLSVMMSSRERGERRASEVSRLAMTIWPDVVTPGHPPVRVKGDSHVPNGQR